MYVSVLPPPLLQLFSWTGGSFSLVFQVLWKLPGGGEGCWFFTPAYLLLLEGALNRRKCLLELENESEECAASLYALCCDGENKTAESLCQCICYSESSENSYPEVYKDCLLVTVNFMMSTLHWGWHFLLLSWKQCDESVWVMLIILEFSAVFYTVVKCSLHHVGLLNSPCSEAGRLKFSIWLTRQY